MIPICIHILFFNFIFAGVYNLAILFMSFFGMFSFLDLLKIEEGVVT